MVLRRHFERSLPSSLLALVLIVPARALAGPGATEAPPTEAPPTDQAAAAEPRPAPEWHRIFSVRTVQPHLHADGVRVVVVPAGGHAQAEAVAKALKAVLDASSRVVEVRRAAAVEIDDDPEIARRVATQGFERILVVRAFDVDGRVQAVVSVLDGQGGSVDAFVAWGDQPLTASETTTLGVSQETLEALSPTTEPAPAPATAAEPEPIDPARAQEMEAWYDRSKLVYDLQHKRFLRGGDPHEALEGAEFYEAVGRSDLARRHRARVRAGWAMVALGGAVVAVGGPTTAVLSDTGREAAVGVSVSLGVGILCAAIGVPLVAGTPASLRERMTMADEHNQRLWQRAKKAARKDATLSLRPAASPTGGGVVLGGRF